MREDKEMWLICHNFLVILEKYVKDEAYGEQVKRVADTCKGQEHTGACHSSHSTGFRVLPFKIICQHFYSLNLTVTIEINTPKPFLKEPSY